MGPETICIGQDVAVRLRGEVAGIEGFGSPPAGDGLLLELEVTRDPIPDLGRMEPVFESTGLWKVLRAGDAFVFELPHLTAVLDFEDLTGRIHLRGPSAPALAFGYPLDEVVFSRLLAERNAIIVHACGVEHDGRGVLLAGASGTGKSTLASLFDGMDRTCVLSDDRVVVSASDGRARLSGTPWHGTSGHGQDRSAPLARILFLRHGKLNEMEPLTPLEAAARLASLSVIPYWHGESSQRAVDAAVETARSVPAAALGFVPDRTAVELVVRALECDVR